MESATKNRQSLDVLRAMVARGCRTATTGRTSWPTAGSAWRTGCGCATAPLVSAYFQALGRARPSYLVSIGTVLAIKVPLLLVLSRGGTTALLLSFPVAELVTAAMALLLLRRHRAAPG